MDNILQIFFKFAFFNVNVDILIQMYCPSYLLLSGVPDFFDRNKILSGGDLSHHQVSHCIRVFFYFV